MKVTNILEKIENLKINRMVGMEGLPFDKVRVAQIKTRFTYGESAFLSAIANEVSAQKAVLCNVLVIEAVIALLNSEPDLKDRVMSAWEKMGGERLDFFEQLENHKPYTVNGDYTVIHISSSHDRGVKYQHEQ
ncbi:hypothetical protein [Vibrio sp. 11986-1-5]|uniref:hypothetical protein n=1 Tax=Vibrio sp. 11986-1-5 TaxID=2211215 RepID=UPI0015E85A4C|nr:hypothetical protein [Vibrio sp. 11986-1-5]